jgi:hypothetical protein
MSKTGSEQLFERLCDQQEIAWRRIEAEAVRTPDYEILLGTTQCVVEVKEIGQNEHDRRREEALSRGNPVVHHLTPGQRVRKKISDQAGQIRARAKGERPGILVLFDDGLIIRHLDPYHIRVAMEGFDTFVLAVPQDPREDVRVTAIKAGARKKMTVTDNTSISAIGVLHTPRQDVLKLALFHNRYAEVPLPFEAAAAHGIQQSYLRCREPGGTSEWIMWETTF